MKVINKAFYILILVILTMHSCTQGNKAVKGITEGTVVYKISYPQQVKETSLSFLLPSEMTLRFSDGNQKLSFKSNFNIYGLDFVHTNNCDSFFTMLKVLERKVYVPTSQASNIFIFDQKEEFEITFNQSETREISGFICKKAIISSLAESKPAFTIWYTTEIGIDSPNKNTPFEIIPGIMLEFEMTYEDVVFHLLAERVIEESHDAEFFSIPTDYEESSIKEIESLIQSVFRQ
jgi:GLPGLI family protein